jgi:hypothetical protein
MSRVEEENIVRRCMRSSSKGIEDGSWFRGTPHYWAEASLPLAYAVACVEVVCQRSEKAGMLYDKIVKAWSESGVKAVSDTIGSMIGKSGREKIRQATLHPERELLPEPNRPFRELETLFSGVKVKREFFKAEETGRLEALISEFIIVGFNRESAMEKGRCRVIPSDNARWLIWAVGMRTALDSHKLTLERVRDFYKVRKHKGRTVDFHKVLTEQPMSRLHRRMVASAKAVGLRLKNDRTIVAAAESWYQCRVVHRNIKMFCDAESWKGVIVDPKNVEKEIRPCDDAVGYIRRLPRMTKK